MTYISTLKWIVPSSCLESLLTIHCFLSMANLVYLTIYWVLQIFYHKLIIFYLSKKLFKPILNQFSLTKQLTL